MAKAVRETTSFAVEVDGATFVVHEGDVFTPTHAVVKKHRELFESEVPTERATAAPKRQR